MSTRNVAVTKTALATARVRRQELDRARDVQDQRIEHAAAAALVASMPALRPSVRWLSRAPMWQRRCGLS
jgi:hypothetical protein